MGAAICGGMERADWPVKQNVLALGLDPAFVDLTAHPGITAEQINSFIDVQLERLRHLGYDVDKCLVNPRVETAQATVTQHLDSRRFNCVMIGAGLRAPEHLLLFERILNLVHARAPHAKICFNASVADTVEAVQRWI
jgi:hypothetical protein